MRLGKPIGNSVYSSVWTIICNPIVDTISKSVTISIANKISKLSTVALWFSIPHINKIIKK